MWRVSVSQNWMRSLRAVSKGRFCSASSEQTVKPPRPRGDTEFVKRRRLYEDHLHKLRLSFASEKANTESQLQDVKQADRQGQKGVAEARAARKRERSLARQAEHLARLKAEQERKMERKVYKRQDLENRWNQVVAKRVEIVDLLAEHADDWVTEESLDRDVERAVDQFFVVGAKQQEELKAIDG